jgi:uncharacterized membrane protein
VEIDIMLENTEKEGEEKREDGINVPSNIFGILIAGFILVFVGIAVLFVASLFTGGSGSVGGVIFIGPIPIVFGAGPNASWLILFSVILGVISIVLFLVWNRRRDESSVG